MGLEQAAEPGVVVELRDFDSVAGREDDRVSALASGHRHHDSATRCGKRQHHVVHELLPDARLVAQRDEHARAFPRQGAEAGAHRREHLSARLRAGDYRDRAARQFLNDTLTPVADDDERPVDGARQDGVDDMGDDRASAEGQKHLVTAHSPREAGRQHNGAHHGIRGLYP